MFLFLFLLDMVYMEIIVQKIEVIIGVYVYVRVYCECGWRWATQQVAHLRIFFFLSFFFCLSLICLLSQVLEFF